jgi:hypothetical protein
LNRGLKHLLALAGLLVLARCTNDYGGFDIVGGEAGSAGIGGSAGSPQGDSGHAGSETGGTEAEMRDAADESADAVSDSVADASDVSPEADASPDVRVDSPADAPVDVLPDRPADAPVDAAPDTITDAQPDVGVDGPSDAAEVGPDGSGEADAPSSSDAPAESEPADADASPVPDASLGNDASVNDASDDTAEAEAGPSCGPGTKPCGTACVNVTDPATGCAGASCAPCSLPHASATCDLNGACAVLVCGSGYDDCDTMPGNGCEALLSSDVDNCGSCGRGCAADGVLSKQCAGGLCVSTCAIDHANCAYPFSGADDGCEVAADDKHCGSCANDCTKQGAGLSCGAAVPGQCGCKSDNDCRVTGSMGTCDTGTGKCSCGGTACQGGEACKKIIGPDTDVCSCNGGNACTASQTCCQWPAGCRNLGADPANCGACGRACPSGFFCSAGECACGGDLECNAGSPGTCAAGQCVCGATTCPKGQRCQPGGTCG